MRLLDGFQSTGSAHSGGASYSTRAGRIESISLTIPYPHSRYDTTPDAIAGFPDRPRRTLILPHLRRHMHQFAR